MEGKFWEVMNRNVAGADGVWYLLSGRIKEVGWGDDQWKIFFHDHYSLKLFSVIISIILLSGIDAMLTLHLISNGAIETNPIMEHFLKCGPLPFLAVKHLLIAASIVLLIMYKNVYLFGTKVRAKFLFIFFLMAFVLVVLWELYLIFFVLN